MNLLTRLETESGRDLDALIALDCGWTRMNAWILSEESWLDPAGEEAALPLFSSSVDAALTLVSEGWRVYALQQDCDYKSWCCGLDTRGRPHGILARAHTPQNAIVIAALKARGNK